MRLIALLAFYDENPAWLSACVTSMAPHIDHVIASDGAYFLYPQAKAWSSLEQHEALLNTCKAAQLGCTIHVPPGAWEENEVGKRSHMFRLGDTIAEDGDWFWVMDSDQIASKVPGDLKARLERTDLDVGETTFVERHPAAVDQAYARLATWEPESTFTVRNFFRALDGLSHAHNHYTVVANGKRLWGNATDGHPIADALELLDLEIEHRTHYRTKHRHDSQYEYYRLRDELGIENGACTVCGKQASGTSTRDWEVVSTDGVWQLAAGWVWVCDEHKPIVDAEAERQIRKLTNGQKGLADMTVTKGKVPATRK